MFASRPHRSVWIWLVIAAVLTGRFEGAHLHLCFDGSEPPAAVHMADGADHDDAHRAETQHVDQDVDLSGATLVKKVMDGVDAPVVFAAALLFLLPVVTQSFVRPAPLLHPLPTRLFAFDPPPRGPPR
jgi:hypothetical protein